MQWLRVPAADLARVVAMSGDDFFAWYSTNDGAVDIDKAWHAVHAVLTGDAWDTDHPLAAAVLGGTEFGEDTGYGPPRFLAPDEVAAVAARLEPISVDDFGSRIDLQQLSDLDVYPDVWDREDERDVTSSTNWRQ